MDQVPQALLTALNAAQRLQIRDLHAAIDWELSEAPVAARAAALDDAIAGLSHRAQGFQNAASQLAAAGIRLGAAYRVAPATPETRDEVLRLTQVAELPASATPAQRAFFDPRRSRAAALRDAWIVFTEQGDLPVLLAPDGRRIVLPLAHAAWDALHVNVQVVPGGAQQTPAAPPGRLPLARTNAEIHLYFDLHPCSCGEPRFGPSQRQYIEDGADLVVRYRATCPACAAERTFSFRLPPTPIATGPEGAHFRYGDDQPSELLDPGEWLQIADALAASTPDLGPDATDEDRRRYRFALGRAAAAIDEAMKFANGFEVPSSALRTERGRAVYAAEPGRFVLPMLFITRDAYRQRLTAAGLA
jgi:hypothetical protein